MKVASCTIIRGGMQTTIQDFGRTGFQDLGVPVGGVLDRQSASIANLLVGNEPQAPLIETSIVGPSIEFHSVMRIGIAGANLSATLDDRPLKNWSTHEVQPGGVLRFGDRVDGCRAYLAIAGMIQVEPWLGSVSACGSQAGIYTPKSILKSGDVLTVEPTKTANLCHRKLDISLFETALFGNRVTVDVTVGPEFERFSDKERANLFDCEFTISPDSNRMGYRMNESILEATPGTDSNRWKMISTGVFPGVVQVPESGTPIVLMRDAQTSGGYPRIGIVNDRGIDRLAQLSPGSRIRFRLV